MKLNLNPKLLAFAFFVCIGSHPALSQFGRDSLIQLTPTIYEITGLGGNVAFKITNQCVVVVDAGVSYEAGMKIKDIIAKTTDKPIKYVILTHYHFDHTHGLAAFGNGATIISHSNTLVNLKNDVKKMDEDIQVTIPQKLIRLNHELTEFKDDAIHKIAIDSAINAETTKLEELKKIKIVYPTQIYDKQWSVILGSDSIQVSYPGNGHTNGDSWVMFKNDKVIHFGDMLFTNCFPYIDALGDSKNWANQLNSVPTDDKYIYIPGHGKIAKSVDIKRFANYLIDLNKAVAGMISQGKNLEEIRKTLSMPAYSDFGFQFLREQNIEAVYNEQTRK